jgi:excisionase family DNA binding protein
MANIYSVKDVAEMLSVNDETVRRWIRDGKLTAERGTGRQGSKITSAALKKFLNSNRGLVTEMAISLLGVLDDIIYDPLYQYDNDNPIGLTLISKIALSWIAVINDNRKLKSKTEVKKALLEKRVELDSATMLLKTEIAKLQKQLEFVNSQEEKIKDYVNTLDDDK